MLSLYKRFILGAVCSLTILTSCAQAAELSNRQLQSVLDDFRLQQGAAAASMAISLPAEATARTFFSGTLAKDSKQALNIGSLAQVDSITKSFIAALMLREQQAGTLSLDDSLGQWLPEYPRWKSIRLRQLLNHTSGIYNYTDSKTMMQTALADPSHYFSAQDLIDYALKEKNYFAPGQGWHYSNTNYVLIGLILEKATEKTIDDLLKNLIKSESLYLNNSSMLHHLVPTQLHSRLMHSYIRVDAEHTIDTTDFSASWLNTAGGILSNTYDIVQWLRALFSMQVMDEQSFSQLTQLVSQKDGHPIHVLTPSEPDGYGLGIEAMASDCQHLGMIWYHSGGGLGYKSLMMWLPQQKIAIAIQYDAMDITALNDPFSPKKPFPQTILHLIEESIAE